MLENVNQHKNYELVTNSQVLYLNSDECKIYNYLQKKRSASVAELEAVFISLDVWGYQLLLNIIKLK